MPRLQTILYLLLFASCGLHQASLHSGENLKVHDGLPSDSATMVFVKPYHDSLDKTMSLVAGISQNSFEKGKPSSNLGNLVADYCLAAGNDYMKNKFGFSLHFCVLNYGGLRSALPAGEIKVENIFELMPFENELVLMKLSGRGMDSLLQYIAFRGGDPVAGGNFEILKQGYSNATIAGLAFDSRRDYYIATNDYMAEGGDGFTMLRNPLEVYYTGLKVRDAILVGMQQEMKKEGLIRNRDEQRIVETK